jgi:hypothetical protein
VHPLVPPPGASPGHRRKCPEGHRRDRHRTAVRTVETTRAAAAAAVAAAAAGKLSGAAAAAAAAAAAEGVRWSA